MAKLMCKSCGGKVKMAKGGMTSTKAIPKAQMGLNYGIPQTGTTNYSAPTMKTGGTSTSRAVKHSCRPGTVRSATGGCVAERPKFQTGGTTKASKFAALAPPYNKATFADRIVGAKKKAKKK